MKVGDTAYIVESNRYVREVEIRRCSGGMLLVRFTDTGGGIQVKAHRLFATREEAEKSIEKAPETKKVGIRMTGGIDRMAILCTATV